MEILFVWMVIMAYLLKGFDTKYFHLVSQYLFIMDCIYFVMVSIQNFEDQFLILDEINNLKEDLQNYLHTCHETMDQNIQATTSVTNGEAQVTKDITKFTVHMYKNRTRIRKLQCMQKHTQAPSPVYAEALSVICSPPPQCMQKHSSVICSPPPGCMQKHSTSFARPFPGVCISNLKWNAEALWVICSPHPRCMQKHSESGASTRCSIASTAPGAWSFYLPAGSHTLPLCLFIL